jgi:hypothetical protein
MRSDYAKVWVVNGDINGFVVPGRGASRPSARPRAEHRSRSVLVMKVARIECGKPLCGAVMRFARAAGGASALPTESPGALGRLLTLGWRRPIAASGKGPQKWKEPIADISLNAILFGCRSSTLRRVLLIPTCKFRR